MTLEELKKLPVWILWRLEENEEGTITKVPYNTNGMKCDYTNPENRHDYYFTKKAFESRKKRPYSGLGIYIAPEHNLCCVDIDHYTQYDGETKQEIYSLVNDFNTFKEISQSGEGIHIFCLGRKPSNCGEKTAETPWLEMYDHDRYIAMTFNQVKEIEGLNNSHEEIVDCQEILTKYANKYLKKEPTKTVPTFSSHSTELNDEELLDIIRKSKGSTTFFDYYENGCKAGDDHSAVDLAFCNILAFWTGKNQEQMQRIFQSSALMRPKWFKNVRKGTPYGEYTIQKACEGCTETFNPQNRNSKYEEEIFLFKCHQRKKEQTSEEVSEPFNKQDVIIEYNKLKDKTRNTIDNAKYILFNDPDLKGMVGKDLFSNKIIVIKDTPWERTALTAKWCDTDASCLRAYLEEYGITQKEKIDDAFTIWANKNAFHPVRDYINNLKWDGVKRLETVFIDYFGADDTDYIKAITRKVFVAGIKRIFEPGCKFDNMLVLKGSQGIGKSTFIKKIAIKEEEWFNDSIDDIRDDKKVTELITGSWIVEIAELAALKKTEVDSVKRQLSKQNDIVRLAYDKFTSEIPRQCIFFGTTNHKEILKDPTGNRRFWIVDCGHYAPIKDVWNDLEDEVDQLWAEAKHFYLQGETTYLSKELEKVANNIQETFMVSNPYAEQINDYLNMKVPAGWDNKSLEEKQTFIKEYNFDQSLYFRTIDKVTALTLWTEACGGSKATYNYKIANDIKVYMRSLSNEWKEKKVRIKGNNPTEGFERIVADKK